MAALVPLQDSSQYSTVVTRLVNQGETQYSDEFPFLVDRVALNVVAGTAAYSLSDYVKSIKRVTYKGTKLDPLTQRDQRQVFNGVAASGKPFWYIHNNVGQNKIQLYPTPAESVSNAGSTNLWAAADIEAMVIVEFWRISDNSTFVIPSWKRTAMLSQYANRQLYMIDGPGNNLKASAYFAKEWQREKEEFTTLLNELHSKPRKLILSGVSGLGSVPASPVLSTDYGIGLDAGE